MPPELELKQASLFINEIDACIYKANTKAINIDSISHEKILKDFQDNILQQLYGRLFNEMEITSIFDDNISNINKRFIGICLLRLWSADNTIFEQDRSFQHKSIKLLDTVFEHSLYKTRELNIKVSDQNFSKINKLKDYVASLEDKLLTIQTYNLDSLSAVDSFKKLYLSIIRGSELKHILPYFMPTDSNSFIDSIFIKLKEYSTSTAELKIPTYNSILEAIEAFLNDGENYKTVYVDIVLNETLQKIQNVLTLDFSSSPFSKPADLSLVAINKKYPFAQTDYAFKVGFTLENHGAGHAYNVNITIDEISADSTVERERYLGTVKVKTSLIEFQCQMLNSTKDMIFIVTYSWENHDKTIQNITKEFLLHGQRDDINWEKLKYTDFYSIEAVESEDELVGRREILTSLITRIEAKKVGSFYIFGQRRVGKSSIVKTLKTELERTNPETNIIFYQETGDYIDPNPNTTINQLATNICNEIKRFDKRLAHIPIPEFKGALSPITGYLSMVSDALPEARILIILDEFDKIPVELYRKGEIGDSFFDTIRAISNKGQYGFLLVGGERMEYIMRDQSQEVNKFKSIRVDYFNKNSHWNDFVDLVVNPIQEYFEVNEDAINYLYDQTAGNPFFTKVICEELIALMVARKDNHITLSDMQEAKEKAVDNAGEQIFAHFWRDGIRDFIVNETETSANRRKVLIALINVIENGALLSETSVIDQCVVMGIGESISLSTLKEFIDRDVLIQHKNIIDFKVLFFKDWLLSGGVSKLKTTLVERDRIDHEQLTSNIALVKSDEIVNLVKDWGPYRGQEITTDKVRQWLEQFGDNVNQRLMFKILQHIHFYNDFEVKSKMKHIYNQIRKNFIEAGNVRTIIGKEFTRKDILVSYLEENPAKSGSEYAKIFADENQIYFKNIIAPDKIERYLDLNKNIHSVAFVDDFIGSGTSAIENITRLLEQYPKMFNNPEITFHYGVICGQQEAKHKISTRMKRLKVNLMVHLIDVLDDSDKVFENDSKVFSPSERYKARTICHDHGSNLVKNNALGYNNCQSIIVFPKTIPNNSLPVLWAENKEWKALFQRPL